MLTDDRLSLCFPNFLLHLKTSTYHVISSHSCGSREGKFPFIEGVHNFFPYESFHTVLFPTN